MQQDDCSAQHLVVFACIFYLREFAQWMDRGQEGGYDLSLRLITLGCRHRNTAADADQAHRLVLRRATNNALPSGPNHRTTPLPFAPGPFIETLHPIPSAFHAWAAP
jgi:hypothetical protein